jgi:hypothetical protein
MDKLENTEISDDEAKKSILLEPDAISQISINDRTFNVVPNGPIKFSQAPRRCHVLCLSDIENDPQLFKLFEADICIAIDTQKMIELIASANKHLGLEVMADSIKYYSNEDELFDLSLEELVFYKPKEPYSRECEYRIAVFWPYDENTQIKTVADSYVNLFHVGTANDHITFDFKSPVYEKVVIGVTGT